MNDPTPSPQLDRTSALGLFNTARSYWRSAEQLKTALPKVTHPDAPQTFLLCHAIELYLKAYLRGSSLDVEGLKRLGHRLAVLGEAALTHGLELAPEHTDLLSHVQEEEVAIEARYIVTGFKQQPTMDALSGLAEALDEKVGAALHSLGIAVRLEQFEPPPAQSADLEHDGEKVLAYLFRADHDHCDVRIITGLVGIDLAMLRYHLDCLAERDFAQLGSIDGDGGEYWIITPTGRKYAVARGLIG
jgi:hypothetical protein